MPTNRSKRKGKKHAGRGRTHRLAGVPFTIVRHFPFTDEERRDIALDVEMNFRAVRGSAKSREEFDCAARTVASHFEAAAVLSENLIDKGKVFAEALRVGIAKLYLIYSATVRGRPVDESLWPSIERGVDAVLAIYAECSRAELFEAFRVVRVRAMRVEAELLKEGKEK